MNTEPDFERRVRDALQREAHRISPHDRRAHILDAAHAQPAHESWWQRMNPAGRGWRVWAPLATGALATVAVVALVVGTAQGPQHAVQPASPAIPSVGVPAPGSELSSPPAITNGTVHVPLYYVGVDYRISPAWVGETKDADKMIHKTYSTDKELLADTLKTWVLYREMTTVQVGDATSPSDIVKAVLKQRYEAPITNHGYEKDPLAFKVHNVTVEPKRIVIDATGTSSEVTDLGLGHAHVQALVWTAQAAAGIGNVPVAIIDSHNTPNEKPTNIVQREHNADDKLLASLLIATPSLDHAEGQPPLVQGWGCTIVGVTRWRIQQGATVVATGKGDIAPCPSRGSWRFQLPKLAVGRYTFVIDYGEGTPQPIPPLEREFTVAKGT